MITVDTDRVMLLTAWVPEVDYDLDPEPGLDEVPYASATVPWEPDGGDTAGLQIDGFEALAVTVEQPGRERLQLEVYEGAYPAWQGIVARQRKARTEQIADTEPVG